MFSDVSNVSIVHASLLSVVPDKDEEDAPGASMWGTCLGQIQLSYMY